MSNTHTHTQISVLSSVRSFLQGGQRGPDLGHQDGVGAQHRQTCSPGTRLRELDAVKDAKRSFGVSPEHNPGARVFDIERNEASCPALASAPTPFPTKCVCVRARARE